MKKLLLILSLFVCGFINSQVIVNNNFVLDQDVPQADGKAIIYWQWQTDEPGFPVYYNTICGWNDTSKVWFKCFKSQNSSINTNTVLLGADNNGFVSRFDISELPKQSLSLSTNTLSISNGNSVILPTYNQNLSINSNTLSISNGNSVILPVYTQSTQIVNLSINTNSLTANGNTVVLPSYNTTLTAGDGINVTQVGNSFTISLTPLTINTVTRTVNSNYTVSTKQANLLYFITCSVTNPLLAGTSVATAFLEYSTNGGSTWILANQTGNSSGVGLAVAIAITNGQTVPLGGTIPANALVRIRTTTSGTASLSSAIGQETYR